MDIRGRRVLAALALAALGGSGVAIASASSNSQIPVVVETDPPAYVAPTGPVMSSEAAARLAIAEAQASGEASSSDISQLEGTLAHNESVLNPEARISEPPETRDWLQTDTYLTVMHGQFTSQRVPEGQTPVRGTVMAVITDARTGFVDATFIGARTPSASGMTVVSLREPAVATAASVKAERGVVLGRLVRVTSPPHGYKSTTKPVVGWTVLIGRGKLPFSRTSDTVATVKTRAGGRFAVHLKAGHYLLAGEFPPGEPNAGEPCAPVHVTVRPGRRLQVQLGCSGA